ncbi:MAG: HK97 family phage prohead protease [Pseudomonadota bacterium]
MRLQGSFPYNRPALLSDGGRRGRPRKEVVAPGAFRFRIEEPAEEIYLLAGHRYDKPLASKRAGTLTFTETAAALLISAVVTPLIAETQHGRDAISLLTAGLATGLSPGFRMPPERVVPPEQAEEITEEPDNPEEGENRALIRTIKDALLYEFSVVTQPAYPDAQVEARRWTPPAGSL